MKKYRVTVESPNQFQYTEEFEAETPEEAEETAKEIFYEHCNYGVSEIKEPTK